MSTIFGSSLTHTLLGMVATFLALSVGIQVLQEMWKYLFTTKAGVYSRVLRDWLGSWAKELLESPALADLQVRGPFQWRRIRSTGKLLPLSRDDLVDGLERTATLWRQRGLAALRLEAKVQDGAGAAPSVGWLKFMDELVNADPGGSENPDRMELLEFFGGIGKSMVAGGEGAPFDAARVLMLYRDRFFERVLDVERRFDRLQQLFEFQYKRRNLLLTFLLSLVVAALLGFPTQAIYLRAKAMSAEETAALVETAQGLYQRADSMARVAAAEGAGPQRDSVAAAAARQAARDLEAVAAALRVEVATGTPGEVVSGLPGVTRLREIWRQQEGSFLTMSLYLLGCVLTAIMICFGAPFWNDILTALGSRARPSPQARDDSLVA